MVYSTVIKIYAANVCTIGRERQCEREKKIKKKEITLRTSFFIDKISIRKNRHWNRLLSTHSNIDIYRNGNGNGNFIIISLTVLPLLLMFVWFEFLFLFPFPFTIFFWFDIFIFSLFNSTASWHFIYIHIMWSGNFQFFNTFLINLEWNLSL